MEILQRGPLGVDLALDSVTPLRPAARKLVLYAHDLRLLYFLVVGQAHLLEALLPFQRLLPHFCVGQRLLKQVSLDMTRCWRQYLGLRMLQLLDVEFSLGVFHGLTVLKLESLAQRHGLENLAEAHLVVLLSLRDLIGVLFEHAIDLIPFSFALSLSRLQRGRVG